MTSQLFWNATQRRSIVTDVSGQPICPGTPVTTYRSTLRNISEERISQSSTFYEHLSVITVLSLARSFYPFCLISPAHTLPISFIHSVISQSHLRLRLPELIYRSFPHHIPYALLIHPMRAVRPAHFILLVRHVRFQAFRGGAVETVLGHCEA
jgi:hypothetical protein